MHALDALDALDAQDTRPKNQEKHQQSFGDP
jgi:hypothetical protein